jgi:hypothetical protein
MRNVSDKICGENLNTQFLFNTPLLIIVPFFLIMWKCMVQPDRPKMEIE